MFDTHCHLQFHSYENDREEVLARCKEKGMILNVVGTQTDTSTKAVELANAHENIYASVGLHPIQNKKVAVSEEEVEFIARGEDFDTAFYENLILSSDKVIAMGETGLDAFHVPKDMPLAEVFDDQWSLFVKHVELATKYALPLVIHVRDCHEEMIRRLKDWKIQEGHEIRAVVHCYTGNWEFAKEYLNLGFYLGFTGVVTFPPKKSNPEAQAELLEVVDKMPLDHILVETDAPFLAPAAYRGKRCEPQMVEEVIRCIAKRRGLSFEELREMTTANARALFTRVGSI